MPILLIIIGIYYISSTIIILDLYKKKVPLEVLEALDIIMAFIPVVRSIYYYLRIK